MYDLSYKNVEDVVVGDKLMGNDSKPRNVLKLYRGSSRMYEVQQIKGINYTVNDKHILVLEDQGKDTRGYVDGKRVYTGREGISGLHKAVADDFYKGSVRSTCRRYKGIKTGLDFKNKKVELDPYYLGLWLGDGTSRDASITNIDKEIKDYLYEELPKIYDVLVKQKDKVTSSIIKRDGKYNDIIQRLKKYDLILNKHIPIDYIRNSRKVRLQLLAGLIDSDGSLAKDYKTKETKGYYITQKNEVLAQNILLLCRTLGYYTTLNKRIAKMKREDGSIYECEVSTIAIFAKDYSEIPVKIERKKCNKVIERNPLRSSIKLVDNGIGDYYGFELDGNHLFLLEDFTITHNTSASKTISILLYLIAKAQSDDTITLTSVVSESIPHLKRGAIRDFKNILQGHKYWKDANWNATDSIYTFETGSQIEFFSADNGDKLRGGRRDRLFINEANNVARDAFDQLEVRTKEFVFLDWNPTNEFWFYTDVKDRPDVDFITLTYLDCLEALDEQIVKAIEARKGNKNWWQVYGLGQLGEVEGKVYKDWNIIDEIPHEARLERYGMDFGYSNDPTAIVGIYKYNGGFILDEITYQKGLSNKQIADTLLNIDRALVIADSAEPKSIDEIRSYGINILPCTKGKDSVNQGIQYVQDQKISITKRSINLIKEYRNYLWQTDKEGRNINVPDVNFNHLMDALRYGLDSYKPVTESSIWIPNNSL